MDVANDDRKARQKMGFRIGQRRDGLMSQLADVRYL